MAHTGNLRDIKKANNPGGYMPEDDEEIEPSREDIDYDQDFEDGEEQHSTKAMRAGPTTGKSPALSRTSKSKANLHNNASLGSVKIDGKKNKRTSSMVKATNSKNNFTTIQGTKTKNGFGDNGVRGSVDQKTTTRFPAININKLYQSVSDSKSKTQFGNKFNIRSVKKPPMVQIEENIEMAKHKIELVNKKRDKLHQ